jgi:hypothetical protein
VESSISGTKRKIYACLLVSEGRSSMMYMYVHVNRLNVEKASPTKMRRSLLPYRVRVGVGRHITFLRKTTLGGLQSLLLAFRWYFMTF